MKFDYVIVGGGSSGSVLASRLSANPKLSVCLLEAGPDTPPGKEPSEVLDTYYSTLFNRSFFWPSLKVQLNASRSGGMPGRFYEQARILGGGSAVNAMIAMRGFPDDYDEWSQMGLAGWAWGDVLPFFRKLENDLDFDGPLHGHQGPITIRRHRRDQWPKFCQAVAEYLETEGWPFVPDMNGAQANGLFPMPMTNTPVHRVSSAIGYLTADVRRRPNLRIRCGAHVERLRFEGLHAVGVTANIEGHQEDIDAREVIVCAGALHTPALLQRSGLGPAAHLQSLGIEVVADLPGIGMNLHDHPTIAVGCHLKPHARQPDTPRAAANLGLRFDSGVPDCATSDIYVSVANKASWHAVGRQLAALVICVQKPYSRGSVQIQSPDPYASPLVDFNLLSDSRDLQRLAQALRLAASIYASEPLKAVANEVFPSAMSERVRQLTAMTTRNRLLAAIGAKALDGPAILRRWLIANVVNPGPNLSSLLADEQTLHNWLRERVSTFYHPVGTCRMGLVGDNQAVVDAEGRVHRMQGLRVADASIMPSTPRANTNLTTIMIAEKVSDCILRAESLLSKGSFAKSSGRPQSVASVA